MGAWAHEGLGGLFYRRDGFDTKQTHTQGRLIWSGQASTARPTAGSRAGTCRGRVAPGQVAWEARRVERECQGGAELLKTGGARPKPEGFAVTGVRTACGAP